MRLHLAHSGIFFRFGRLTEFSAGKSCKIYMRIFPACPHGARRYDDSPTTHWNAHSQAGIPVKTRLRGDDSGFRFFFIGTSPSEQAAIDNLYAAAEREGYKIDGSSSNSVG